MAGDRVHVDQVEALAHYLVLSLGLRQEERAEVHIGVEIDVHGQFELVNGHVFKPLPEASSVIVNQNMDRTMLLNDFGPGGGCALNIGKVGSVEVYAFERCDADDGLDVLDQLRG